MTKLSKFDNLKYAVTNFAIVIGKFYNLKDCRNKHVTTKMFELRFIILDFKSKIYLSKENLLG